MAGPPDLVDTLPDAAVRRRLRAARLLLWLEALWPALVWLASWLALVAAVAVFDLLPLLPGWLHLGVLLALLLPLPLILRLALRAKRPDWVAAARRLESDSGLHHRPFQSVWDQPVGELPETALLWQHHRQRALAEIARTRLSCPRSDMAARDPWGLRAGALLLLVVALAGGTHDWPARLQRAMQPAVQLPGLGPDALEVWVTPPAYTGLAPLLLRSDAKADEVVSVPAGSTVLAVLSGGWGTARLVAGGVETAFSRQRDGGQRVEIQIETGERLAIRQLGREIAAWPLKVTADLSPAIEFASAPEPAERGRLHMAVTASDDYGLTRLWTEFRRVGAPMDEPPLQVDLPMPAGRPKMAGSSSWHDLTAHPWAGLPVVAQPMAEDALGQRGAGETTLLTLPERSFLNPNARALIEQRRLVTESRTNAAGAMGVLDRLSVETGRFNDDLLTFLAMRAARHALAAADFDLGEVQELLWNAALRIEDGDLAAAEQRLEEARQSLEQAVDDNVSAAELDRLLDQLQAALRRYIAALAERMGQPEDDSAASGAELSDQELMDMVQSMRDMAAVGARDGLKKMLRDLAGILDDLQSRTPQAPSSAANAGIRDLRDLAKRQQRLLEQSHRQQQAGDGSAQAASKQQQELRQTLESVRAQLTEGLGQAPAALDEAGRAMDQAVEALHQGDWAAATQAQGMALDNLSQAVREALEDMAAGSMAGAGGLPRDPLGRPTGSGDGDDGSTQVPDQAEIRKARTILEELRRRAGEFRRPLAERDYLQRLLRQF